MMYFKLVKVFFKENYSLKQILGSNLKQSKTKTILMSLLIIYGLGSILLSFGFLFFQIGSIFKELDSLDSMLTYIFMYATFLSAFFVIIRASSYLLHYKDYDFLTSLPLKNVEVIAAKISVMLVMIYLSVYLFTAPMIFSYLYHGGFSIYSLVVIIISLLFIPIIPLIVFSFVSLVINYVFSKLGINKIMNIIMTFGLLLAFMYFSFSFNTGGDNPFLNQEALLSSLSQYIPTVKLFFMSISDQNILAFFAFIMVNILLLITYIYLIQSIVHKTNQNQTKARKRRKRFTKYRHRSVTQAIISKELNKFFSVNIYIFNTGFGLLLMFIGGVASFIYSDKIGAFAAQLLQVNLQVELMILVILAFLMSTVYTSAISLSLEGKNLWLLKSLPLDAKKVIISKMFFNVLLALPFAVFFVLALSLALKTPFILILMMLIILVTFSFVTSILGSIINLHFPKFHFKNETEVVKQSMGAFLGMFSGLGISIILGVLFFFINKVFSVEITLLFLSLFNIMIFTISYVYIDKKAESLFMHFS